MTKKTKAHKVIGQPTLNGKPVTITDSWEKCTLNQYLRILKMKDDTVELLSIITGLEYDHLKNAKINGLEKLLYLSRFINTTPTMPDKVEKIGPFKLPLNAKKQFDIQFESLAQFEDMRVIMKTVDLKNIPALTESYAKYCALYLQKIRDGEYDGQKALGMVDEIYTYPALEVIAAGSFFLIRLLILSNGTAEASPNLVQAPTKNTGKRSKKSLGSTAR